MEYRDNLQNKIDSVKREYIESKIRDGATRVDIAKDLGISVRTATRLISKLGIKFNGRHPKVS